MAYDLNQFIADCRDILARDPGPAANRSASISSDCWPTRILSKNIVVTQCHAEQGFLYEDPKLGFQILAHINDKARVSPPHDHGASWAIYGQATKYTDMIEWESIDFAPISRRRPQTDQVGVVGSGQAG